MALGQVQTVLVCQSSSVSNTAGACPAGKTLVAQDAYILVPDSSSYFNETPDFSSYAEFSGLGFGAVLTCYMVGKGFGMLARLLR
jgi:hypothetical protein